MNTDRLTMLLSYYKDDPHDPFTCYALAIEYLNHAPEKSLNLFRQLLLEHEKYVPVYYQAGKLLAESGHHQEAVNVITKGIEIAGAEKDFKAQNELRSLLDSMD